MPTIDEITNGLVTGGLSSSDQAVLITLGLASVDEGSGEVVTDPPTPDNILFILATMVEVAPGGGYRLKTSAIGPGGGIVAPGPVRFDYWLVSARNQLAIATRSVAVRVLAYRGSSPLAATVYPASIAVTTGTPQPADFKPAEWDADGSASVLVGPDGAIDAPAAGTVAYVYVRLDNAPETTIERVATVAFL